MNPADSAPAGDAAAFSLPLTLYKRFHVLSARYNTAMVVALIAIVALPLILIWPLLGADAWSEVQADFDGNIHLWLILILASGLAIYLWSTVRYQRLLVTDRGLEYRSPLRGPLGFLRILSPDWQLDWHQIQSVELEKGARLKHKDIRRRYLVFDTRAGMPKRLRPYTWYAKPDRTGMSMRDVIGLKDERFLAIVHESPLVRILADRGLLDASVEVPAKDPLSNIPGGKFDLTKHPGIILLLWAMSFLAGYAVVDGFFLSPWRYLESAPIGPFLVAAVVAVSIAVMLTRPAPRLERWTLVGLFGLAAAGAVYPALPRINAATDPDGATAYRYRQVEPGHFQSVDHADMPELFFTRGMEFWNNLPADSEREFMLARGSLDFWQLDLAEVRAAQRRYFRENGSE